jgi:hypothetical protein
MIRKLKDFHLSEELRELARAGARLLAAECDVAVDQASDVAERVAGFFRDNAAAVEKNVKKILQLEQSLVPQCLQQRQTEEERAEDPSAVRQGPDARLEDIIAFDIASLIARRNGLGPATSRNGLRERIPEEVARGDCLAHMHVGYRFILANALLRLAPDPVRSVHSNPHIRRAAAQKVQKEYHRLH